MLKNRRGVALAALTIAAAALSGCAVYQPGPYAYAAPGYYAPAYAPYGYYGGGIDFSFRGGGHSRRW